MITRSKLHLDADASLRALERALIARGHDVTRTPTPWMPLDATDEQQLLGATAQGRCLFTFNVRDFLALAQRYPHHAGIILAAQARWSLTELIEALDAALSETEAAEWTGAVRWLNDYRDETET